MIQSFSNKKNAYFSLLRACLALFLSLFLATSCSDSGCIDADDFGEYESQTIEVEANAAQESCTFAYGKKISDSGHGAGIIPCLTSGSIDVTDENDITQTSTQGCLDFEPESATANTANTAKYRNLCVSHCVDLCNSNASGNSVSAEPDWTSTDAKVSGKNIGVTIRPGSQISIRAIGTVSLGDTLQYPDIYVNAGNPMPHAHESNWAQNAFFDARKNQSIFIKFSGAWFDGADDTNPTDGVDYTDDVNPAASLGAGALRPDGTDNDRVIYNGAKRLIVFAIPHPEGYDFNVDAADEESGTRGVPLLPDARAWDCTYSGGSLVEGVCGNSPTGYTASGYTNANDALANMAFPTNNQFKSTMLPTNGGFIRWLGDDLLPETYDPFAQNSVSCSGASGNCSNINSVNANQGRIIGAALGSDDIEIENNQQSAYKLSFKSLSGDSGCNITLNSVSIADSNSNVIKTFDNVGIVHNAWSSQHITLEPTQKIVISQNNSLHTGGASCGALIGVKFLKYHDINITQSGLVKFTMLRGAGNCTISGRIINPKGSHLEFGGLEPDFYEYGPFYDSITDPMASISVPASVTSVITRDVTWSNSFFVRKGQTLRFAPESWNGTWMANNTSVRSCGIGMAMYIEPRPAILCRGQAADLIDNPACTPLYQGSSLSGCQDLEVTCSDPANQSYCPAFCQKPITCTGDGSVANNFTRTGCTIGLEPQDCTYVDDTHTIGSCDSCATKMFANATRSAKSEVDAIDQCYDLENYTGKVKNISDSNSQTKAEIDAFLSVPTLSKGAARLEPFNGEYGNFANFNASPENQTTGANTNAVYKLRSPITFSSSSRVKFFVLDGTHFNNSVVGLNAYSNNTIPGTSYSGANGFMINVSGTLEFNNGVWLQARLCQESSSSSSICKNTNPIALNGQPTIIEINPPDESSVAGASPDLTTDTNYRFNDYGSLMRTSALGVDGDCTTGVTGVENFSGAAFYCHTHQYFNKTQFAAKTTTEKNAINNEVSRLRLTFKILDPEIGNCNITGVNDGIAMNNPFFDGSVAEGQSGPSPNIGAICATGEIPGDGSLSSPGTCAKEFYCANRYSNNSGKYFVNIRVKNLADGNISNIIGAVINPIVEIMDGKRDDPNTEGNEATIGQAERVYRLLISDSRYQAILTISLVTMFTFYGFGYLIGVVEMNHADIISRIIKIGLIYLFVGETGWEWFNKIVVKLFKDSTDYIAFMMASSFDESPELRNAISGGNFYDKSVLFSSVDKVFGLFFASVVQKKISALLFASIFGWAYLMIIYSSFMLYVYAVSNAVLLYLTAQVFISILFVLGPIFFVFTLFSQTKEMFDSWLKQLIGFSLQQIFLLTTLAFFNMLMYEVIKMSLGYKICWDDVWTLNIITRITLLSFWTIASLPPRTNQHSEVGNIGNPEGIPSLFTILFIWVIASLMHKFIGFMTDLAGGIAGGLKASAMGSGVAALAKEMREGASKAMGKISDTIGLEKPLRQLDKALFDSGKLAEEARGKKRKQNAMDQGNKFAMQNAGDKAMKDYKINNAKEFAGMTEEEKRDKLKDVREKGMDAEGKKLGLDDATIKRLKSDTGNKYVGDNIFGYMAQGARQAASSGGTLGTSLNDRSIDTSLSHSEGQEALQRMTKDEREQFISDTESGKVKVGSSALNRIGKNKLRAVAAVATLGASEAGIRGFKAAKGKADDFMLSGVAARELEDAGVISRNKAGFSRSKEDKQLISERTQQLKATKENNKDRGISSDGAAELRRESDYIDKKQELSESDDGLVSKAGSYIATGAKRLFRADNLNSKAKGSKKEKLKAKLKGDLSRIEEERGNLEAAHDEAVDQYDAAQEKVKETKPYKDMRALEDKKGNLSRGEKKQLARLKQEVSSTKDSQESKEAAMAANDIGSQMEELDERHSEIESTLEKLDAPPKEGLISRAKKFVGNLRKKKDDAPPPAPGPDSDA